VFAHACAAWRRGHCFQESGRYLSIGSAPDLDHGPQSRQYRRAAGAERETVRDQERLRCDRRWPLMQGVALPAADLVD
jgi:hypothetical protein